MLLREGAKLLAVSCWDGEGTDEAAARQRQREVAADAGALDAAAFRARYRLP